MNAREKLLLVYHVVRYLGDTKDVHRSIKIGNLLTESGVIDRAVEKLRRYPGGDDLFRKRDLSFGHPREYYRQFPAGSIGRAYYEHLTRHGLDPLVFPMVDAQSDAGYLECLVRQVHDLLHVVTGFGVDEVGELGLQAFKARQFNWPFAFIGFGGGGFWALFNRPDKMDELVDAWYRGFQLADQMKPLMLVDWNAIWDKPLDEVRRELTIDRHEQQRASALSA